MHQTCANGSVSRAIAFVADHLGLVHGCAAAGPAVRLRAITARLSSVTILAIRMVTAIVATRNSMGRTGAAGVAWIGPADLTRPIAAGLAAVLGPPVRARLTVFVGGRGGWCARPTRCARTLFTHSRGLASHPLA